MTSPVVNNMIPTATMEAKTTRKAGLNRVHRCPVGYYLLRVTRLRVGSPTEYSRQTCVTRWLGVRRTPIDRT